MTRRSKLSLTIFSLIIIFLIPQVISLAGAQVAGTANSWVSKASLPMAGSDYGAASVNGIIYVLGSSVNYAYNPNTNSWSQKTPMPVPRTEFAIAACNNKIYVIGGVDSNGSSSQLMRPMTLRQIHGQLRLHCLLVGVRCRRVLLMGKSM